MKKVIRNIRITHIILFLACTGTLVSIIIGSFGFIATSKINSNVANMYDDQLMPITYISTIKENFMSIRLNHANTKIGFNPKYMTDIEENEKAILDSYKKYTSTPSDETEQKYLQSFSDNYKIYLELVKKSIADMEGGKKLSKEEAEKISNIGDKIEKCLDDLNKYDIKYAESDKFESDKIFKINRNLLIGILITCTLIFSFIAILTIRIIKTYLNNVDNMLKELASGNLDLDIKDEGRNEFEHMKMNIGNTVKSFSQIIKTLKEKTELINVSSENLSAISEEMASSSDNVSNAINDVAKGTGDQAESLVDITNILNEFSVSVNEIVSSLSELNISAKDVSKTANISSEKMVELDSSFKFVGSTFKNFAEKIEVLGNSINKIDEITILINNIAEQTNLLALNAAIEAARAGESGRGFAVVADEIRKLAEQSKESSNNISVLINEISKETKNIVQHTGDIDGRLKNSSDVISDSLVSFKEIITSIEDVVPKINALNKTAEDIEKEKNNIFERVEGASSIAEEISASSEEIAASSQEMNSSSQEVAKTANGFASLTMELQEGINRFKIR
ncbi:methyl-accepting chemotaxis protein [Hathewaya histolytica]|uniref:Methyl-accepting chemotaxis protein n=1 Tax=Hathewaya histolytica TaxID=1498 RepID=A0A4U9RIL5_HATHI|nr:methyl-accepting chemotaxis protein [Hathewaya histolytica]VTQ91081.1 methyl-accepting chemotaxis protein [Hathewaya histolytica]